MEGNYLESIRKQFQYYQQLGERSFAQLKDEELFWQFNPASNSIAVIVNHLSGNMKSRWTDFLTSDGEKTWRQRDQEFEDVLETRADVLAAWEEGWTCVFTALDSLHADNLATLIYIRNQGHTIVEAINRQLAHYAYHIGQIVFIARMCKGTDWESLSIPKGASKVYNQKKFEQEKARGHFTDEFLDQEK